MQLWALFHACWQSELHIPSNFLFPTFEFLHIIFVASWLKEHGRPVVVISRLRPKKKGEKIGNATRGERWCGLSRCRGLPFPTKRMRWPFWQRNVFFFSLSLSLLRESAQLKPDAEQNFIIRRINPSVGSSSFHASLPRPRELLKAHTCPIGLLILQNLFMYHPIRLQRKTFFFQLRGESRTCFMEETCGQRVPLPGGVGLHLIPLYRKKGGVSKKEKKK